jgi:hypothetical protein
MLRKIGYLRLEQIAPVTHRPLLVIPEKEWFESDAKCWKMSNMSG